MQVNSLNEIQFVLRIACQDLIETPAKKHLMLHNPELLMSVSFVVSRQKPWAHNFNESALNSFY